MLNSIISVSGLTLTTVLILMGAAMVLGVLGALLYMKLNRCSKSFAMTLAILPLVAGTVILAVNGNLGAGIAVAGSFSLVRFRSVQGSAKEILAVFLAMAVGLCLGAGYVAIACLLFVLYAVMTLALGALHFGEAADNERMLRISVPEALDYDGLFEEVLKEKTAAYELETVRTAEMGSVYQLFYRVKLKTTGDSKALLDALRERNGNLPITLGHAGPVKEEM